MSSDTLPQRFTKVDDLTRSDHYYLTNDDICYFIGEYTARAGYSYSATNKLVVNFKKPMDRKGRPEWKYKDRAISSAAVAFANALGPKGLNELTFVPIPPSNAKEDPLYDDRMTRMLRLMRRDPPLDVRELIIQSVSMEPVHKMQSRPSPNSIEAQYIMGEQQTMPLKPWVAIVDDVLTTGAHFRAAKSFLSKWFPNARYIGLFLARRAPQTSGPCRDDLPDTPL